MEGSGLSRTFIDGIEAVAYTIPTDVPEADGTLEWNETTIVIVQARAGTVGGTGYSYTHSSASQIIREVLAPVVHGRDVMDVTGTWEGMRRAIRNHGRPGLVSTALSAVDTALWDLKARVLGIPLVDLLGRVRDSVAVYGSGGFTSYDMERLTSQLAGWVDDGMRRVKMKVGRDAIRDVERVAAVRAAIGPCPELFIDANGGWSRREALAFAEEIEQYGVTWYEEPVTSDDLEGLRLLRDRSPAPMQIAAGEYGYDLFYFRRMLEANCVDVLQADVTRCGGISELLRIGALCAAYNVPLSAHTAPMLHAHVACAIPQIIHVEYFHDHVRIEQMLFDGCLHQGGGCLTPASDIAGNGLSLRRDVAAQYRV